MIKYSHFIEEKPVARGVLPTLKREIRTMINERGQEVLDKTPVQIPIDMGKPASSLMDYIHALYRQQAEQADVETFEDANNFDIPDETGIEMMDTPYEQDFDHFETGATPSAEPPAVPAEPQEVTE